jgi:hypothetical protein
MTIRYGFFVRLHDGKTDVLPRQETLAMAEVTDAGWFKNRVVS